MNGSAQNPFGGDDPFTKDWKWEHVVTKDGKTVDVGVRQKNGNGTKQERMKLPGLEGQVDIAMKVCLTIGVALIVWTSIGNFLQLAGFIVAAIGFGLLFGRK